MLAQTYDIACRFSPKSNGRRSVSKADEVRVLICTDVLSGEGQNLQESRCGSVKLGLPWAIIRLIQRAGRVTVLASGPRSICYSFLPADGVEQLIQLRSASASA